MLGIGAGLKAYDPKNMFAGAGAAMQTTAAAGISDMNAEDQDLRQLSAEQRARMRQLEDQAYNKKEKAAEEDRRYERLKETEGRTDKRNQNNARFSAELPWTLERERNAKYRGVANAVTSPGTKGPQNNQWLADLLASMGIDPHGGDSPANPYEDNPTPPKKSRLNPRYGLSVSP